MISTGSSDAKVMGVSQSEMVKSEVAIRTEQDLSAPRNSVSLQVMGVQIKRVYVDFRCRGQLW